MEALCYSMHEPKKLKRKIKKKECQDKGWFRPGVVLIIKKNNTLYNSFFSEENDLKMKERNGRKGR